jgi:NADP-dependent 3-hydroxy acid dehydrogenase YdfG
MSENIKRKVVIVTGASSGLGEAAARHLSSEGAKVVLAARRTDRIDNLEKEIISAGGEALAVAVDVTKIEDMRSLADLTLKKFGTIDVLINNAGIMPLSLVESISVKEWDQMIDVNLKGVVYGVAAVLPHMKAKKSGQIITTASVAGHKVFLSLLFTPQRSLLFATLWKGFVRKHAPQYQNNDCVAWGRQDRTS